MFHNQLDFFNFQHNNEEEADSSQNLFKFPELIQQTKPIILCPIKVNNSVSTTSHPNNHENSNSNQKPNKKRIRRVWTKEEDEKLLNAIKEQEPIVWDEVAKHLPGRTAVQCKECYCFRLAPGIKKGPFELWEDFIILTEHERIGNHWKLIARKLKGRTMFAVKNRWYTFLSDKSKADLIQLIL